MPEVNKAAQDSGLPRWVFWSTPETVARQVPSMMAILETVAAVAFYWWLAIHLETYGFIMTALIAAPLVLLRSQESTNLSISWFKRWERRWKAPSDIPSDFNDLSFAIPFVIVSAFLTYVTLHLISPYSAQLAFKLSAGNGDLEWLIRALFVGLVSGAVPMAALIVVNEFGVQTSTMYSIYGSLLSLIIPLATKSATIPAGHSVLIPIIIAVAWGMYLPYGLLAAGLRACAAVRFLRSGIRALPDNFRATTLSTSLMNLPEIMPGLPHKRSRLTVVAVLEPLQGETRFMKYIVAPLMLSAFFVPGWIYRISIKSTAWFWWPLAFLGGELYRAKEPGWFYKSITETLWGRTSLVLSFVTIAAFAIGNLLPGLFAAGGLPERSLLGAIGFFFAFDWSLLVWQLPLLVAVLLNIAILYWFDYAIRKYNYARQSGTNPELTGALLASADTSFRSIEYIARIRLILLVVYWLAIGAHTALYFNSKECWVRVAPNVHAWATWVYGTSTPPLPACLK